MRGATGCSKFRSTGMTAAVLALSAVVSLTTAAATVQGTEAQRLSQELGSANAEIARLRRLNAVLEAKEQHSPSVDVSGAVTSSRSIETEVSQLALHKPSAPSNRELGSALHDASLVRRLSASVQTLRRECVELVNALVLTERNDQLLQGLVGGHDQNQSSNTSIAGPSKPNEQQQKIKDQAVQNQSSNTSIAGSSKSNEQQQKVKDQAVQNQSSNKSIAGPSKLNEQQQKNKDQAVQNQSSNTSILGPSKSNEQQQKIKDPPVQNQSSNKSIAGPSKLNEQQQKIKDRGTCRNRKSNTTLVATSSYDNFGSNAYTRNLKRIVPGPKMHIQPVVGDFLPKGSSEGKSSGWPWSDGFGHAGTFDYLIGSFPHAMATYKDSNGIKVLVTHGPVLREINLEGPTAGLVVSLGGCMNNSTLNTSSPVVNSFQCPKQLQECDRMIGSKQYSDRLTSEQKHSVESCYTDALKCQRTCDLGQRVNINTGDREATRAGMLVFKDNGVYKALWTVGNSPDLGGKFVSANQLVTMDLSGADRGQVKHFAGKLEKTALEVQDGPRNVATFNFQPRLIRKQKRIYLLGPYADGGMQKGLLVCKGSADQCGCTIDSIKGGCTNFLREIVLTSADEKAVGSVSTIQGFKMISTLEKLKEPPDTPGNINVTGFTELLGLVNLQSAMESSAIYDDHGTTKFLISVPCGVKTIGRAMLSCALTGPRCKSVKTVKGQYLWASDHRERKLASDRSLCRHACEPIMGDCRYAVKYMGMKLGQGPHGCATESVPAMVVSPDNSYALLYQTGSMILLSLMLQGKQKGTLNIFSAVKIGGLQNFIFTRQTQVAYVDAGSVNTIDLTPTIDCDRYEFLTQGLEPLRTEKLGRIDMYHKKEYYLGIKLKDNRVWSFTGYRKVSGVKEYDGGGFYFTKSLLCFRPCSHGTVEQNCTKEQYVPGVQDVCCVLKNRVLGVPQVTNDTEKKDTLATMGRVPTEKLDDRDGMKVY